MIDAVRQGRVEARSARVPEDSATFSVAFLSSRGELLAANKAFQRLLRYESFSAMRGKNFSQAREILLSLAREFPLNPLYAEQAGRLPN